MKNLSPYQDDCFEFYENALKRKEDDGLKKLLGIIEPQVKQAFANFKSHHDANTLQQLVSDAHCKANQKALEKLYDYSSLSLTQLREIIERAQPQSVRYTCQNCTLTLHDSFDHIVPQSEFPEFVIHPLNLFPSCTKCNGHKSKIWRKAGQRTTLNLYLDKLPDVQFLYVDIQPDTATEIDFRFYVANKNRIYPALFALIEEHYRRLHLPSRMKKTAITEYGAFKSKVEQSLKSRPLNDILQDIIDAAEKDKKSYGYNHWRLIMQQGLARSSHFQALFP